MVGVRCFIDGAWEEGDGAAGAPVINPATGSVVADVRWASVDQVGRAASAARLAFDAGAWPRASKEDRAEALRAIAEGMDARREELIDLVVTEVGSPISFASSGQVEAAIRQFAWYADATQEMVTDEGLPERAGPPASASVVSWEPGGVAALITPFNFPLLVLAWKLGAALSAGCTAVVLPSPITPLATEAFFRIIADLDLPPGVVNLVLAGPEGGAALTLHPDVDIVSFTGSVAVGSQVMRQAAGSVKKVILELGGKSAGILLTGGDVELFASAMVSRVCRTAGQACAAITRALVPKDDYERFLSAAAVAVENVVVGDPLNPQTQMGPVITAAARARIAGYVQRAVEAGGRVIAQGTCPAQCGGFFIEPTLVDGLPHDAELCQEEIFGPVLVAMPYRDVDHAVALANGTRFGLSAAIWGPTEEALSLGRRLRDGTVSIGGGGAPRPDAPWGGFGQSGIGRERGLLGIREFMEPKHIEWAT